MSTYTYLITGASRSLGLGYARALLATRPEVRIVAAARNPAAASQLQALANEEANKGRVYLLTLDVTDKESVKKTARELDESGFLADGGLDALVSNSGVNPCPQIKPSDVEPDDLLDNLQVNTFGVLNVTKHFLPLLRKGTGKQIFSVSSICASLDAWGSNDTTTAYSMSKVALNMHQRKLATELAPENFTVIVFHPGYVKTDMNDGEGELTIEEAAEQALKNVFLRDGLGPKDSGSFFRYSGEIIPW
ncbi:hypothetical protein JCM8097_008710 [Rhodosporidiobolus ruineniae]